MDFSEIGRELYRVAKDVRASPLDAGYIEEVLDRLSVRVHDIRRRLYDGVSDLEDAVAERDESGESEEALPFYEKTVEMYALASDDSGEAVVKSLDNAADAIYYGEPKKASELVGKAMDAASKYASCIDSLERLAKDEKSRGDAMDGRSVFAEGFSDALDTFLGTVAEEKGKMAKAVDGIGRVSKAVRAYRPDENIF